MKFASKEIRNQFQTANISSLNELKGWNKNKYRNMLAFMQEWTEDLTERQNELEQERQQQILKMLNSENNKPQYEKQSRLKIEHLIKQEFLKKIQSLYVKQLMMVNMQDSYMEQSARQAPDCLNRSEQTFNDQNNYFDRSSARYQQSRS